MTLKVIVDRLFLNQKLAGMKTLSRFPLTPYEYYSYLQTSNDIFRSTQKKICTNNNMYILFIQNSSWSKNTHSNKKKQVWKNWFTIDNRIELIINEIVR